MSENNELKGRTELARILHSQPLSEVKSVDLIRPTGREEIGAKRVGNEVVFPPEDTMAG